MTRISEALKLVDTAALIDEIHDRKQLLKQMVGSLYPDIVTGEIRQLTHRYEALGGEHLAQALFDRAQAANTV